MAKLIDKYNAAKDFVVKDIWRADMDNMSTRKRSAFNILKILIIAVRGFIENGCAVRASALTYFTLLSSVPVVALAFALAKGFGLEDFVVNVIKDSFAANPETADYLISFSSSMLENAKGGLIAGIGVIMLLYSVFELLSHVEEAFNFMWNIKKNRPILRKVTDYMTIMVFSPILIITASSATFFIRAKLGDYFADYLSEYSDGTQFVVITHPDIFLDGFILSRRYIYRTIVTICENFRKLLCITAISLDFM